MKIWNKAAIMNYSFEDYVDIPALQDLTDELYKATSIPTAILTRNGEILTGSGWQRICTEFHRKHPDLERECIESDTKIRKQLDKGEKYVIYKCPRGLVDASSPVIINGEHVANVFAGQVFIDPPDDETEIFFREQAKKHGLDEEKYIEAYREIPVYPAEKFRFALSFLSKLAQMIASIGSARINEIRAEKVIEEREERFRQIAENIDEVFWIVSPDWSKVHYISPAYEKIWGRTCDSLYNRPMDWIDAIVEKDKQKTIDYIAEKSSGNFTEIVFPDYRIKHADGSIRWIRARGFPVLNDKGEIYRIAGIAENISERKKAEEALKESEKKSRAWIENSPLCTKIVDLDFNLQYMSSSGIRDLKIDDITQFYGKPYPFDFYPESFKKKMTENLERVKETGEIVTQEASVEDIKGDELWFHSTLVPVNDEEGRIEYIMVVSMETTARVRAEEALIKERNTLRILINTLPYPIYFKDTEGKFIDCNYANVNDLSFASGRMDLKKNDVLGKKDYDFLPTELADKFREEEKSIIMGKKTLIHELYSNKEKSKFSLNTKIPITDSEGKITGLVCINHDISEQKLVEKELREREVDLKDSQRIAQLGSWRLDIASNQVVWSDELYKMYGFDPALPPPPYTEHQKLFTPESWSKLSVSLQNTSDTGIPYELELETVRGGGSNGWMWMRGEAVLDENGKTTGLWGAAQDITGRKKVEEELKLHKTYFEELLRNSPEAIVIHDDEGNIQLHNKEFIELFGFDEEEITGCSIDKIVVPDDLYNEAASFTKDLSEGKRIEVDTVRKHKNGRLINVSLLGAPISVDMKQIGNFCIYRDITERKKSEEEKKKLQEQLYQAQKMESIGRLAGGIAHDFNNILTGIMGYAEMLKMQFPDINSSEGKAADIIYQGSERAAGLTNQLLGFARKGKYNPVILDINDQIKEMIRVIEKIFEKNITVNYDFEENINKIEADVNQIDQVLSNLIINAKDAMPKGGNLVFKTENTFVDEKSEKKFPSLKSGHYAKISISDSGIGIPKNIKNDIFEPFFTTKGEGKGTGLGLATVFGIVKNHNGHISVYSEPDEGTTFTLYFPVSEKEITKSEKNAEVVKGNATILIIDDEDHVRELSKSLLENMGYRIFTAENGLEGLKLYKEKKEEINLVLLDLIMPEMPGEETFSKLLSLDPDVKIVLFSGFSKEEKAEKMLNGGALGFIQKPFNAAELSQAINRVING